MTSQYQYLQQAKAIIRRDPSLTDVQVAEAMGIPDRIIMLGARPGDVMSTIATARRDVAAARSWEQPEPARSEPRPARREPPPPGEQVPFEQRVTPSEFGSPPGERMPDAG